MTDIFIDTDVIVDFLIDRKPNSTEAAVIFTLIDKKMLHGYTSSLSFSNLYYLLRKLETHNRAIAKLESLAEIIDILKVDGNSIRRALQSDFPDFEDGIQYFSAAEYKKISVIITRNTRDYRKSALPVMTPAEFLKAVAGGNP